MGDPAWIFARFCTLALVVLATSCDSLERRAKPGVVPIAAPGAAGPGAETAANKSGRGSADAPAPAEAQPKRAVEVLRGTGRFLNPAPHRAVAVAGGDGGITLNFVNAEITEVVRAVLGGILKVNFAVDPGVKGMLTLQTSAPVQRGAVLAALESALNVAGAAIVAGPGGVYRVVPRAKAAGLGPPATIAGDGAGRRAGFTIRIVPLKFVSAGEMTKILAPLASKGAIARTDGARNLLVLAAPARSSRRSRT